MSLALVTVIHDSAPELERMLASVRRFVEPFPQVIVVDSGSSDDGAQRAAAWGAEVVRLDGNPGFGTANNAGVQRAEGDIVALLNPDIELLDGGLPALADAARLRDGLHVPRLLSADGTVQDTAHPVPGTPIGLVRALSPGPLRRAIGERRVGWAIAAAMVARTETLRALGPFDPRAFLFFEDLDLCLRAGRSGVPTVLHPGIRLSHAGGHSTRPAFGGEPIELQVGRRREVVGASLGPHALRRDDVAQLLEHGIRAVRSRDRAYLRAIRRARSRERQNSPS